MMNFWRLALLALALSACSLAEDVTPPPGPATLAPVAGESQEAVTFTVGPATAGPAAPEANLLAEQLGTVSGQVWNGTLETGAPAGLQVTLHAFDAHGTTPDSATTITGTTTLDGVFQFDGVLFSASRQFLVTTVYDQATYASEMLAFAPGHAVLEATLRVYESTGDPSSLRVDQVHTFIEFASPGGMTVGQLYVFSNLGSATYGADGQSALHFSLPAGAAEVSVQGATPGEDLIATQAGFDLAQPVPPGQGTAQVLVSFSLPYAGALDFEQSMAYPVENLNVMLTDVSVKLSDSPLQALGVQDTMGMQFQVFEQTDLPAPAVLRFRLSGEPGVAANAALPAGDAASAPAARPWGMLAGIGGAGLGLFLAGAWLYFRRTPAPKPAASREELLLALADLDERSETGQISQPDYQREREDLKRQLREQWS